MAWALPAQHKERWWWERSLGSMMFVLSSAAEAGGLGWCCLEGEKGAGEGAALLFLGRFWHFFWQRVRPASHPGSGHALHGSATSLGVTELHAWGCSLPDPSHGDGQEPCREALPT